MRSLRPAFLFEAHSLQLRMERRPDLEMDHGLRYTLDRSAYSPGSVVWCG